MLRLHFSLVFTMTTIATATSSYKDTDIVSNLPGLTYSLNFKQYAGYLNASHGNFLFYWLVESQSNSSTDPLLLWFNGGPGCSALEGLLTEFGPFHVNPDGQTLFENVFSWNKMANILFVEMPAKVGFSYSTNANSTYSDDATAQENYLAIVDFLNNYPEYKQRKFYIVGESYAGVYQRDGSGERDAVKECCPSNVTQDHCDYSQRIHFDNYGNAVANDNSSRCDRIVERLGYDRLFSIPGFNPYNPYFACYQRPVRSDKVTYSETYHRTRGAEQGQVPGRTFVDQASLLHWTSTDNQAGFPCFTGQSNVQYLNANVVRQALHVANAAGHWNDCNHQVGKAYLQQYPNTTEIFDAIIRSNYPIQILVYNGDVDIVCNFLGDEWFVENLAIKYNMNVNISRQPWSWQLTSNYKPVLGGFWKRLTTVNSKVTIDLVTVKGAGHVAPLDRPGPCQQMINNFIRGSNYSTPTGFSIQPNKLLPQYNPQKYTPTASTRQGIRIAVPFYVISLAISVSLIMRELL